MAECILSMTRMALAPDYQESMTELAHDFASLVETSQKAYSHDNCHTVNDMAKCSSLWGRKKKHRKQFLNLMEETQNPELAESEHKRRKLMKRMLTNCSEALLQVANEEDLAKQRHLMQTIQTGLSSLLLPILPSVKDVED